MHTFHLITIVCLIKAYVFNHVIGVKSNTDLHDLQIILTMLIKNNSALWQRTISVSWVLKFIWVFDDLWWRDRGIGSEMKMGKSLPLEVCFWNSWKLNPINSCLKHVFLTFINDPSLLQTKCIDISLTWHSYLCILVLYANHYWHCFRVTISNMNIDNSLFINLFDWNHGFYPFYIKIFYRINKFWIFILCYIVKLNIFFCWYDNKLLVIDLRKID